MIVKEVFLKDEGQAKLRSGIKKIAGAVKSTLGPSGQTVLLESENHTRGLTVTKDGVTIARSINLFDPIENLAVQLMKQAADQTAVAAGDGPQPIYAKVLTPFGWKTMGSIKEGDEVCGTNGTIQKVLGVFPKGKLDVYEVGFADGRVVECSGNHLWSVTTHYGVQKTITTEEMIKDFARITPAGHLESRYYVQNGEVEFYEKGNLPLDSYTLGVLLGDGSLSGTGAIELSLGFKKQHVLDSLILPEGIKVNSRRDEKKNYIRARFEGKNSEGDTMMDIIFNLGLLGVKSATKFIPKVYLHSSIESRKKLLKGLTDTDGYINTKGLFEFSTISNQLADDFQELICGLGLSFSRRLHTRDKDKDSYSNTSIHRITQLKGYKHGSKIKSIVKTEKVTDMQCIKVSNEDHLYITDGYIPTHNTSTSIVLTEAIIDAFQALHLEKLNKTEVIRAVNAITDDVVKLLDSMSRKVSKRTLVDVATISANNDKELGKLIADTFKKVDLVTVENSANASTYNEIISGMRIDRGWTSKYFVNNEKTEECVFENPYILLTDIEINNLTLLEETLAHVIREQKPLLIIGNLSPNALNTLNMNVARKVIKACHIIPPSFGYRQKDLMHDLAVALGAKYISESIGDNLYTLTPLDLGQAAKVIVSKDSTIIMRNDNTDEAVEKHLADLKSMEADSMDATDKKFLNERIASISKGVGIIYVGGNSDIEQKEKYDRVDDAVRAVAAAVEDGILPGGGIALANCADAISDRYADKSENFMAAVSILTNALIVPFTQIMLNAGEDPKAIGQTILEKHDLFFGYDAKNRVFGDLMKLGVVDPTKVTKSALINAVSVATTIVSTEAIVTNMRDESSK